jgi:alpha-tubulin suppressor-like RCC1 family protein
MARAEYVVLAAFLTVACDTGSLTGQGGVNSERSTIEASAETAYADAVATVTLTVTARNASGSPLADRRVEFTASGTANLLSASIVATDAAGRAVVTLASSTVETKLVTAALDGVPLPHGVSIAFVAGPPFGLHFTAQPRDTIAGEVLAPMIDVAVVDSRGRLVDTGVHGVEIAVQGGGAGAILHGTLSAPSEGGVASFGDLWIDRSGAGYVLVAKADSLVPATSSAFAVAAAAVDPANSGVEAASPSVTAGGSTVLTVTVRDAFGNPVAGEPVSLTATGSGNQLQQPVAATDEAGQAVGTLGSTIAGVRAVTGYLSGARALSGVASVTFQPGPPAAGPGASTLVALTSEGSADGTPVVLTATIKDGFGNVIPGAVVTLSASGGATCASPTEPTDASGVATGSVRSWAAGAHTISASVGTVVVATTQVTFAPPQASAALSTVVAIPGLVVADGATPSVVTVRVFDTMGRPMVNAIVSLSYTGDADIAPAGASTDTAGHATFQVTAAVPTEGTVTATIGSGADALALPQTAAVTFAPGRSLGGTVAGLVTDGLVLSSPGLPELAVAAGATTFTFGSPLPEGARYAVTARGRAARQVCQVTGGAGTVGVGDIAGIEVNCASPAWTSIVTGAGTTYAFNADGSLWAWGWNDSGQIGPATPRSVPVPVSLGHRFAAVAGGSDHTLALEPDGSLWAWGGNVSGQLGDGTTTDRAEPAAIGTGFVRVAAGRSHSLGLRADGSLWAWGDNARGQLGDGTTTSRPMPVLIGSGYSRIAAGSSHSLALMSDGSLWAWGDNYRGQIGDGSDFATKRLVPVQVGGGFGDLAANGDRSAGLKTDGTLWTWGRGSVGDGTHADRRTPFLVGPGFASVALGENHMCGLKTDGTLWAWGSNNYGSIGDGTTTYRTTPVQVATDVATVGAGGLHTVVVKTDGTLWTWGGNQGGELGVGAVTATQPAPLQTVAGAGWRTVAAGAFHTFALASDQTLWAWGANDGGQLGDGTTTRRPAPVLIGEGYVTVTGGERFSAGVKTDGSLWTWGFNGYGQLGDGSSVTTRPSPASIGTGYAAVAAGFVHAVALRLDGTVWTFGNNLHGQLGDGTTAMRSTPMKVLDGASRVAASSGATLALEGSGTLWGWGSLEPSSVVPTVRGTQFKAVALGVTHGVAVKADGTLWGWGDNRWGQVGDGSGQPTAVPVQIGTGFVAVAAGDYHSLALKTDGTLWAWGENGNGQLGDGTLTNRLTPVLVEAGVAQFAAGSIHSLAILTDGTLRAWGDNYASQLGARWWSLNPVPVP